MEKSNLKKVVFKLLTLGIAIFALTFSVIYSQNKKDKKKKKEEIIFDSSKSGIPKDLMKPKEKNKDDVKQEQIDKSKEKQSESKDESQNKRDGIIMPSSKAPAIPSN